MRKYTLSQPQTLGGSRTIPRYTHGPNCNMIGPAKRTQLPVAKAQNHQPGVQDYKDSLFFSLHLINLAAVSRTKSCTVIVVRLFANGSILFLVVACDRSIAALACVDRRHFCK